MFQILEPNGGVFEVDQFMMSFKLAPDWPQAAIAMVTKG